MLAGFLFSPTVWIWALQSISLARGQSTNVMCGADYDWAKNSRGQSPCLVAAFLGSQCSQSGVLNIPAFDAPDEEYSGPLSNNLCQCNTAYYSLISACGDCQHHPFLPWTTYTGNCTTVTVGYGLSIPPGTEIPSWALLDVTKANVYNATAALDKSEQEAAQPSSTPPPSSTTSATSSPVSSASQKKDNKSAVIGGVVGGVIFLVLVTTGLCFYFMRRRRTIHETAAARHSFVLGGQAYPPPMTHANSDDTTTVSMIKSPTTGTLPLDLNRSQSGYDRPLSGDTGYTAFSHNRSLSGSSILMGSTSPEPFGRFYNTPGDPSLEYSARAPPPTDMMSLRTTGTTGYSGAAEI